MRSSVRSPYNAIRRAAEVCRLLGIDQRARSISAVPGLIRVRVDEEALARVGRARLEAALAAEVADLGPVVVTRHAGLVEILRERGLIDRGAEVVAHVGDPAVIRGRRVIGVVPLRVAAEALSVTEVEVALPPELRGQSDLPVDAIRPHVGRTRTYVVRDVTEWR